jgi:ABC-type oligopeptide transport system substrate-binding subunit
MKKLLALLLALVLVLSLAACGNSDVEEPETTVTETPETTEPADTPAVEEPAKEPEAGQKIKTAQQQYDEAKAELEESVAAQEAALTETYGSVEAAYAALDQLITDLAVTAVDDKTLEVKLSNPVPYFIDLMTFASFFPASEAFYNEVGDAYGRTAENFLYDGAFLFSEWKLSERHYLTKNPNYWNASNVALNAVDYRVVEGISNDTAVELYLSGETDSTGLAGENVEKYGNRPDAISREDVVLFYLDVNFANGQITPEKEVLGLADARKALNMAIDKSYITDVIYANGSLPADYFVPLGFQSNAAGEDFRDVAEARNGGGDGYNKYDPAMAAELWQGVLTETGYPAVELDMIIYQGDTAAQVGTHIKNELEKNLPGLTVNILALPFAEKLERTTVGDYELNWGGWGPDYPDAMTWMDMWITGGPYNRGGYSNADYDAVIDATKSGDLTAPDKAEERFNALVDLEKKLLEEDQVIIPLYQRAALGLRNPAIKDLKAQSFGADYIYQWASIDNEDGVLNLIEAENIPALITWQATDSVSFEILGNINSGLYTLDLNGVPTPDIAKSVDVSADGLTYTFTLRDANWTKQDGSVYAPVTANDFVFAWKKLLDPAEAAQYNIMIETASILNGKEAVGLNIELVALEAEKENLEQLSVDDFEDIIEEE